MYSSGFGELGLAIIGILLIVVLALLVVYIFFLLSLQRAMQQVSPEVRTMEPGLVWLMLIPLFATVWGFIVVTRIADSMANEFRRRNIPVDEERPGYSIGLAWCILSAVGLLQNVDALKAVGGLAGLAGFICWIIYWVKINRFKTMLENSSQFQQFQQNPYGQQYQQQQQYQQNPYGQQNPYQNPQNPYQQNPYQQNPNQPNPFQNPNQNPTAPNPFENPGNTPPPFDGTK